MFYNGSYTVLPKVKFSLRSLTITLTLEKEVSETHNN